MKFIDSAKIYVKAGDGGKGCHSFYRDKYTRKGIPDGGDGGKGQDIIIRSDRNLHTLLDFQFNRHFFGLKGGNGGSKHKKGKDSTPRVIRVPCGTIIQDVKTHCCLRELNKDGEEVTVAVGGKGGRGNKHKPQASPGEYGEEKEILLDLKLIADVGVIGFPNVGKSTLISQISNARPEIAAYPFTTKFPVLGAVGQRDKAFIIADIPGLICGSSKGKGLGDRFLRHVERTKILLHLIDMAASEGRDPVEDYRIIKQELKNYDQDLFKKKQILAANKMDLEGAELNLERFRKVIKKKIYPLSALKNIGLEELIEAIRQRL